MSVAEEYILDVSEESKYLTSKVGSGYIHINSKDLFIMLSDFYNAGYIKCIKDVNDKYKKFSNSSTRSGGYDMDTNTILEQINNLDSKYDNKLDNIKKDIHLLDKRTNNIEIRLDSIDETLKIMKIEQQEKKRFWTKDVWVPIIIGIITAIASSITSAIIVSKLLKQ